MAAVVGIDLSSFAIDLVKTDAAWLAGFLDGEGCFQIVRGSRNATYDASIMAANAHREAIDRCASLAGGSICKVGAPRPGQKESYRWNLRGRGVTPLLTAILPYLVIKSEQAEILMLLRLSSEVGARLGKSTLSGEDRQWRETLKLAVNCLNFRGSATPPAEMLAALETVREFRARDSGQLTLLRVS